MTALTLVLTLALSPRGVPPQAPPPLQAPPIRNQMARPVPPPLPVLRRDCGCGKSACYCGLDCRCKKGPRCCQACTCGRKVGREVEPPCSPNCACGCNRGGPCECVDDGPGVRETSEVRRHRIVYQDYIARGFSPDYVSARVAYRQWQLALRRASAINFAAVPPVHRRTSQAVRPQAVHPQTVRPRTAYQPRYQPRPQPQYRPRWQPSYVPSYRPSGGCST